MYKVHYSLTRRLSIGKSLILSLPVVAGILVTSLVATTEKVDAQIGFGQVTPPQPILTQSTGTPVISSRILNLLTSGTGRWFEFRPDVPRCQIYDFKSVIGVPGSLQTVRNNYSFNTLFGANECQFTRGILPTNFGATTSLLTNNGVIQIVYPGSSTPERVQIVGSFRIVNNLPQQIAVWRGDRDNRGRPIYRVWHRSSR
jgi:hypothetical protein